jgi:hypothetical protein
MENNKSPQFKKHQKELIMKALTDPVFRKALASNPEKALDKKLTSAKKKEITKILTAVKAIEAQISHLADELLCANGGGCGIA